MTSSFSNSTGCKYCKVHPLTLLLPRLRTAGEARGILDPLKFEKDDVICCAPTKYPKLFTRAFGALSEHINFKLGL